MLTLEKIASKYFKTNLKLEMSQEEEVQFEQAEECWLCEQPFTEVFMIILQENTEEQLIIYVT